MIKSKVGYLCLNCGNLVAHGHSAIKPSEHHEGHHAAHHEHEAHHEAQHEPAPHHHESKPEHHHEHHSEPAHHEAKKPAPAKKSTKVAVTNRTVSDIKRKSH